MMWQMIEVVVACNPPPFIQLFQVGGTKDEPLPRGGSQIFTNTVAHLGPFYIPS